MGIILLLGRLGLASSVWWGEPMRKPFTKTIIPVLLIILTVGCRPAAPTAAPIPSASPMPATSMPLVATPIPPALAPTALPGALTVAVPQGNPPKLDGTLSPGEWDSARREKFSDGSELLLVQNGGYLYLSIRAHIQDVTAWSVCLDRGGEIAVLHSSAALGTAVYKRTESGWQRTRAFAWTLRDTSNSETARQQRKRFLEKEGWLASLGTMGKPEEVEFQLAMPQSTLRLAVAFLLPPSFNRAALWPVGLDDVRNMGLLRGDAPAQARFSPERWAEVVVAGYETAGPAPIPGSEATPLPPDGRGAGLIAFYSNRDGNTEIYAIDPDSSDLYRLTNNSTDDMAPAISPDGARIAFRSATDIYVMNIDGTERQRLTDTSVYDSHPDWSPDGTQIAFVSERDGNREIYIMDADGSNVQRLTNDLADDMRPDWSPDGARILFNSERDGNIEIYVMDTDGSNLQRLTGDPKWELFPQWSSNGAQIAYTLATPNQWDQEIYVMSADGTNARRLTNLPAASENPAWAPDGTQIAFQTDRDGNFEIYVMNADGSDQRRLTNHPGNDYWPSWGPAPGSGLYLGQTPPGLDVEVFAPGIVSVEEGKEYNITISPDLQEIFFTRRTPGGRDDRIWTSRLENGKLTVPELAPFAYDLLETDACFTPDGNRLYFNSARPLPGEETASPLPNMWFVDKTETGWSEPQFVGPPLNDYHPVYFSIADDGTLYFTRSSPRGIYYAEPEAGRYLEARRFPDEINQVRDVAHPAVAPDESYIIVNSSYEQNGRLVGSLYISFRRPDGSWTKAVSMHDTLQASEADVYAIPRITPDGTYLFFERYDRETDRSDIYWVSTDVIKQLGPETSRTE